MMERNEILKENTELKKEMNIIVSKIRGIEAENQIQA